jgi:hypothetical protein
VLGDVARREHVRNTCLHTVINQHAAVDRDAGGSGQVSVGPNADSCQEDVARQRRAVAQHESAHSFTAPQRGRFHAEADVDAELAKVRSHEFAGPLVELPGQQARPALQGVSSGRTGAARA